MQEKPSRADECEVSPFGKVAHVLTLQIEVERHLEEQHTAQ